jgi:hypothetical protein
MARAVCEKGTVYFVLRIIEENISFGGASSVTTSLRFGDRRSGFFITLKPI